MKTRFIILLSLFFALQPRISFSQAQVDHFKDADGNTFHQLFVDYHISEVLDIRYVSDGTPISGELSADGYSIVIKNYSGAGSVKLKIKTDSGEEKEITKSRCYIDPVLVNL